MADIRIEIKNLNAIRSAFTKAPALMIRELNTAIRKTVLSVGAESRRNTPVDTGRLRASTYESFQPLRGEVGTRTSYDIYVHDGTRYIRARPYLMRAVGSSQGNIDKFFAEAVENVLVRIGKSI